MLGGLFSALILLVVLVVAVYAPYRISRRMGFDKGPSILIGLSGLVGLPIILWWALDWPNERGGNPDPEVFR